MAFLQNMTRRKLPGSNIAFAVGGILFVSGAVAFGLQLAGATALFVTAWLALAYAAFGRKTLAAELFLTIGWAALLLFCIHVYSDSPHGWISALVAAIAVFDSVSMLRRRAYRQTLGTNDTSSENA